MFALPWTRTPVLIRRVFSCLALLLAFLPALPIRAEEAKQPLRIAAAADMRFALDELLVGFRKAHPEYDAQASYGSSGTLFAQLENGAPFDLFLSADVKFPRLLIEHGHGEKDSVFLYPMSLPTARPRWRRSSISRSTML
jgi:molybdate transport system substrate-binding protein